MSLVQLTHGLIFRLLINIMATLFTWTEFKNLMDYLKDESDFPDFPIIRDSVFARIEAYLQRKLEYNTIIEIVDAETTMIPLKLLPVTSVTSVNLIADDSTQTAVEYRITNFGIQLRNFIYDFDSDAARIQVAYSGGYESTDGVLAVPESIKRAGLYQTKFEIQSKNNFGSETITTDAGTIRRPSIQLLKEVAETLNPFVHSLRPDGGGYRGY